MRQTESIADLVWSLCDGKRSRMSNSTYAFLALAVLTLFAVFAFNRLVALRQAWQRAFADIDVQLKQRQDLVPNLVAAVKGYAAHENSVFTEVAQARALAIGAANMKEKSAAEGALSGALTNLMAVAESYPQLKASDNFLKLQSDLDDIENKIAAARRFLNSAVAEYNAVIQQFPNVLLAGPLGFTAAQMFALDATERLEDKDAPKINMSA